MQVVRRTCILFALGLLVSNGEVQLSHLRIMGVLQRFAISYFFTSLIMMYVPNNKRCGEVGVPEVLTHLWEWCIILALIILHTCLTFLLDVPGCPRG